VFLRVRQSAVMVGMAILFLVCVAGAGMTVYLSWRVGLALRPPLSKLQLGIRFAIIAVALLALRIRRDPIERCAWLLAILAAGSTVLYEVGYSAVLVRFSRLFFHFVAYTFGALVIVRWFVRRTSVERLRITEA